MSDLDLFDHLNRGDWVEIEGRKCQFLGRTGDGYIKYAKEFGKRRSGSAASWQSLWDKGKLEVTGDYNA